MKRSFRPAHVWSGFARFMSAVSAQMILHCEVGFQGSCRAIWAVWSPHHLKLIDWLIEIGADWQEKVLLRSTTKFI